jgi:nitroimidazol reductase NimA-like FMN-containing flavoprotein (pyridoxamine 5'-phosphate oxidase superfamily)
MTPDTKLTRDRQVIDRILHASQVLRLGLSVEGEASIFPLAFGYDGRSIFFHTAREGGKLALFERCPRVCLEFEHGVRLLRDDPNPCKWSFAYESVIGRGHVAELTEPAEKEGGLREIIRHYAGTEVALPLEDLAKVRVWRVTLEAVTGRRAHADDS